MKLIYRVSPNGSVRVWREDWFGDQFETFSEKAFAVLRRNEASQRGIFTISDDTPVEFVEASEED